MNSLLSPKEKEDLLGAWQKEGGISGNALKIIACIFMFFDHLSQGVALNSIGFQVSRTYSSLGIPVFWNIPLGEIMGTVATLFGRIAFPIFCFLLVQGALLTRDYKKQVLRLLVFALISEVPFNLCISGTLFYPGHQNVFFELAFGVATVAILHKMETHFGGRKKSLLQALAFILMAVLCEVLNFDYGAAGIIAIVLFYLAVWSRRRTMTMGLFAFLFEAPLYGMVYLSLPLIYSYNGKRGMGSRYGFYIFYPGHLLLLYLLSLWI